MPLLREGEAIGAMLIRRPTSEPFTDPQIALLETFADQAVIAIENARLFEELEPRNPDLTEALERQTATAEILRVISPLADRRPARARRRSRETPLASAMPPPLRSSSGYDGTLMHVVAHHNLGGRRPLEALGRQWPMRPLTAGSVPARLRFSTPAR